MPFLLSKWYLDCVSDAGAVHLGYAAQLSSGVLRMRTASLLTASPGSPPHSALTVAGAALPELEPGTLGWTVPALKLHGTWTASAEPLTAELLDEPGALSWSCLAPRARVDLHHAGRHLRGTGYAERLTLRVAPWKLPIEELRWGRAHVGPRTLVWIDWRGARPRRHIFLDGHEVEGQVWDEVVKTPELEVRLTRALTLRSGDLATTAFARLPALSRILARHRLRLDETKWLSRARAGAHEGWAIHEVVRWS